MYRSYCCRKQPDLVRIDDMVAYFCGNEECDTFVFQFTPGEDLDELKEWWNIKCGMIDPKQSLARLIERAELPKRLHHVFEQLNLYEVEEIKYLSPTQCRRKFRLTLGEVARLFKAVRSMK